MYGTFFQSKPVWNYIYQSLGNQRKSSTSIKKLKKEKEIWCSPVLMGLDGVGHGLGRWDVLLDFQQLDGPSFAFKPGPFAHGLQSNVASEVEDVIDFLWYLVETCSNL